MPGLAAVSFHEWRGQSPVDYQGSGGILSVSRHIRAFALVCALAIAGAARPASASERWSLLADVLFTQLNPDQGLPTRFTTSVAEDKDGFLWFGTSGGLARWDGYHFKTFKSGSAALPSSYIVSLHTDAQGFLWIGTAGGGLARHEPGTERFTVFGPGPDGVSDGQVWAVDDDGQGGLWIATDGGLDHRDAQGAWTRERHDDANPASLPDNHVTALRHDSKGRVWAGTRRGLARKDPGAAGFVVVPLPGDDDPEIRPEIWCVFEDSAGRIWIGAKNRGVFVIEAGQDAPRPVRENKVHENNGRDAAGLEHQTVNTVAEAAPGHMWVGTFGQGIVMIDTASWETRRIQHEAVRPSSLVHDDVRAMHVDRAGFLWIGTSGGLSRYDTRQTAVTTIFGEWGRATALSDIDVWSVLAAADGRVWAGLREGGVDILDPQGGRVGGLRPDAARPDSALPPDRVYAMVQTAGGEVFLGTNRGLYRTDAAGKRVTRVKVDPAHPDLPIRTLRAAEGALWIGTLWDGLWRLDPVKGMATGHWSRETLAGERIEVIAPGGDGWLWVGGASGLTRFNTATGEGEKILPDAGDPRSLSAAWVSALATDAKGRLWVGTLGGGLNIMDGRDDAGRPRFTRLGEAQGLPNASAARLQPDRTGRMWVSTNDGLAVIDPETLSVRALHRAEGVAITFNWVNSGAVTEAGEILFGGSGGLTVIRPALLAPWSYQPPVVVTDLRVGGKTADWSRALTVPADANSLTVEFAALDYSAPELNRYAYRLQGYDKDWIPAPWTQRLAAYTNLPPGDYALAIRGSNREGMWAEKLLTLPVRVAPAWRQTLWFQVALVLSGLAFVSLLVRGRTAYLRARQRQLEQEVAARTAELRTANARLFDLATTDTLTGCANRRHLLERAAGAIALAHRSGQAISLLIADLDHFKRVNDTYGHAGGDKVLVAAAGAYAAHVRTSDILARIGGEEFAILMPGTDKDGAMILAERLRQAVADTVIDIDGKDVRVTTSMGLAALGRNESFDALFARADAALYAAKHAGRNRVQAAESGTKN